MTNKKSPSRCCATFFVIAADYQYDSFRKMCTPSIRNFLFAIMSTSDISLKR